MTARTARRCPAGLTLAVAALPLGGCLWGDASENAARWIRMDPAPEMYTLSLRKTDYKNDYAIMMNEDMRMMREDFQRFWHLDRQSRLSIYPIPR